MDENDEIIPTPDSALLDIIKDLVSLEPLVDKTLFREPIDQDKFETQQQVRSIVSHFEDYLQTCLRSEAPNPARSQVKFARTSRQIQLDQLRYHLSYLKETVLDKMNSALMHRRFKSARLTPTSTIIKGSTLGAAERNKRNRDHKQTVSDAVELAKLVFRIGVADPTISLPQPDQGASSISSSSASGSSNSRPLPSTARSAITEAIAAAIDKKQKRIEVCLDVFLF